MIKKMPKFASVLFTACAVLGLGAAPALAASSSGAETYRQNECFGDDFYRVCVDNHGEYNNVITPSGNNNWQNNAKYEYTVYLAGEVWYSGKGSFHNHYLFKKGEQQVYDYRVRDTQNFNGQTCTLDYAFHYANGQVQFDDYDYGCV